MRIQRTGRVVFNDASISVWEEGVSDARRVGGLAGADEWERQFKKDVFSRIVQQLHRLGWQTEIPADMIERYSRSFALNYRHCRKGDLEARLEIGGRHIELKMYQNVVNVENPNGGQYDFNKEERMPYLLRLEMERTRRRIRTYLCNVFEGYVFDDKHADGRSNKRGPGKLTAEQWVQGCYETSWHFKGDPNAYEIRNNQRKSADGNLLEHGQRVWFFDWDGRCCTGIAKYNINNMWWVITGKYDVSNKACFDLYTSCPENPRRKRNERRRRAKLEKLLAKAMDSMDFERAAVLRDLIFPKKEPLYLVWHKDHKLYHCANFSGYTDKQIHAGKFTKTEIDKWMGAGVTESNLDLVVPMGGAA